MLRSETVAGLLLIGAACLAMVWANSPAAHSYFAVREWQVGPGELHLSLEAWASDALLSVFFFIAGLELKREFVVGDLRDRRRAALPVAAALGGMIVPALLFFAVNAGSGTGNGWAIPSATDIAFSLAVLAVVSTHLPAGLRTFLLAVAIVDDLLAITVIAVFYTATLHLAFLAIAIIPLAGFAVLAQLRLARWWIALPLAVLVWLLVHDSGVHSTVAGVLLAFCVPVRPGTKHGGRLGLPGSADALEHRLRPFSSCFAVPVFAFLASGVALGGWSAYLHGLAQPITLGIVLGLVVGKPVGVLTGTLLCSAVLRTRMDRETSWWDAVGLAMLCGMGFTVALLISELAFPDSEQHVDYARIGVITGTLISAVLAAVVLRIRNRHYRQIEQEETVDADQDGIPDVFEAP